MAVEIKVSPDEKLELVQTYLIDPSPTSEYFNITELSDTFSGGKNAFLIAGSELLNANTEIKVQVKDSEGNPLYLEFANGTPEYYEGISKVVAVYVYPTETAFGPAKITILGEIKDAPDEWKGKYNVKWERTININPALPNTTKVRFYKRPTVLIKETLEPIYRIESGSKVPSNVTASFADVKISQLETFAGDVKRVKVFRTSEGDISDYDLLQDILIESKELLTTYDISGSVKGEAGLFTADTITKAWNTGSLNVFLTGSRVENGCRITGSGNFVYTSSLNLNKNNKYEFGIDAFYSASAVSNLGIYLSGSENGIYLVGKLSGSVPTKNLLNSVISFSVPNNEPTASLYLSQSQGEWHIGNLSLKLSEDTAFSPNEISFVTSMPTVIGNETYNFKFEFYDVNNNFIPVAVTQSATFTGGNNTVAGTITIVSSSIAEFSQSYFEDVFSGSNSLTGSISSVSASISGTISNVSASSANFIILVSGSLSSSINVVSGSQYVLSQSVSSLSASFDTRISSSQYTANSESLYQVYSASAFLDKFIFTDENGKLNSPPTASGNGLYLGSTYLGFYSESQWRTYMDDQGDFYLTGSNNNFLAWSGQLGTLQVQGTINIQGGNAATTSSVSTAAANAVTSASAYSTASSNNTSNSLAPNIFTDSTGQIRRPPTVQVGTSNGLFLGSSYLGYYSGSDWKTYMDNSGQFFLTGSASNYLKWNGSTLTIAGAINITAGGNAATTTDTANAVTSGSNFAANAAASASAVDSKVFTNTVGLINKVGTPSGEGLYLGSKNLGYYDGGSWKSFLSSSGLFYLTGSAGGNALLWDGTNLTIRGTINIEGGNAATQTYAQGQKDLAIASGSASATAVSVSLAPNIFTDSKGKIVRPPLTGSAGLFLGSTNLGYYDATDWKTYMASNGDFYLTGSGAYLKWFPGTGTLQIKGSIDITGGNAATTTDTANAVTSGSNAAATAGANAVTSGSNFAANAAASASAVQTNLNTVDGKIFTNALGRIVKTPSPSTKGLYLGSTNLGYYSGSAWKTYMDDNGLFYLTGSAGGNALLWDGSTLTIRGSINVTGGNAATSQDLTDGLSTKYDASNPSGFQNNTSARTGGSVGGWSINGSQIFNSNVQIDNTNSRIDFLSGGVVKTRIKSGNADIGTFTTTPITMAAGTTATNSQIGSSIIPGPLIVDESAGGNTAEVTFTAPVAANGLPFSITIPYPSVSSIGYSSVTNLGTGTSWTWEYYGRLDYVIRLNNSSGAVIASGNKVLKNESTANLIDPDLVTHDGFSAGTMIIPNVGTAVSGQVYWLSVTLNTFVRTKINPSGATPIGNAGSATSGVNGWDATAGTAGLLAVASRAEYATNGAQIGSSEGTYVALGDAAGAGFVGAFNGNVQVIGVLTAGAISASDKRAKTNIQTIDNGINTIKKLNPVKFDWLQHITGNNEFEKGYGFIADDVENILPDLVYKRKGYQFDDFKHLEYNSFHAIAVKAIQELTEKVEKLEEEIRLLKN